ncbi:uncharacterized protein F5147DRAFT_838226 [Suillus discolor]|uniref:Uncharacterized protein n=1 Tax=Suillus discolor TaxID=1912936 RepID=A0A9P7F2L5_9AGAM|nr:uncharacterized protein F5147DRAFT_838226 [Suillus discolor]KAG2104685.1 hypothetical protein F5147DRAFT_838226 [Suillus discolor]
MSVSALEVKLGRPRVRLAASGRLCNRSAQASFLINLTVLTPMFIILWNTGDCRFTARLFKEIFVQVCLYINTSAPQAALLGAYKGSKRPVLALVFLPAPPAPPCAPPAPPCTPPLTLPALVYTVRRFIFTRQKNLNSPNKRNINVDPYIRMWKSLPATLLISWHLIVLLLRTSLPSARHLVALLLAPCCPPQHLVALLSAPLCPPQHLVALLSAPCCPPPAYIVTLRSGTSLPCSQHLGRPSIILHPGGLGNILSVPCKSRDKRKTQTFVNIPGADVRRHQLALRMQALINPTSPDATVAAALDSSSSNADVTMDISNDDNEWVYESGHNTPEPHLPSPSQCDISIEPQRRTLPDKASRKLYGTWTGNYPHPNRTSLDISCKNCRTAA